jgi:hypothetical protein
MRDTMRPISKLSATRPIPKRALLILVLLAGCPQEEGEQLDMAMPPPDQSVLLSQCGKPGDTGNSLGVGKFCTSTDDCGGPGLRTNICSSLGNGPNPSPDDTYFCTIYPCKADAGADACGENATCTCGSSGGGSGCACTPNYCLTP